MAERFDGLQDTAERQSLNEAVREARGMVREGMEHQLPENGNSMMQLSRDLLEMQHNTEKQMSGIQRLAQEMQLAIEQSRQTADTSKELLDFFREQESGIRTSVQATSNYVVEEEAQKAVAQIEEVAEAARKVIGKMEQEAMARTLKMRSVTLKEKVWETLEHGTTVLLLIILASYLIRMWL